MKPLSIFTSQSYLLKENNSKYVVKRYDAVTSIKWYFIVPTFRAYPFASRPSERMRRELDFMTYKWHGIVSVPKIIDFDLDSFTVYREYIEGSEVKELQDFKLIGRALRIIHENNFVLGDTKPSNFLIDREKERVYVIDAEQSLESDLTKYKSWDLLVLLFFIAIEYVYDIKKFEEISLIILETYEPIPEIIKGILSIENTPLLSFFPPLHLEYLRKIIAQSL